MSFFDAMTTDDIFTENAMPTSSTSGSYMLDWFFHMGAMRANTDADILKRFILAFADDRALAIKSVFALRNVRGGMGERRAFRVVARWLAEAHPEILVDNMHLIPHYGRWDDVLFVAMGTPVESLAVSFIASALLDGEKLCAKWMPREGKKHGEMARRLAKALGLSARQYRKLLASNTDVVESKMCGDEWDKIKFEHVPSVAFKKYKKAFARHEPERFGEFLASVEKGEKQIHAGAIFPHDVVGSTVYHSDSEWRAIEAQWANLPDYGAPGGTLVVSDVSGSMTGQPMAVSVALGLYFAERLEGPFKDIVCTFSRHPQFVKLSGKLRDRYRTVYNMDWGMNTNLTAVFDLMLTQAAKHNLPPEQMPKFILILSDMQFDECVDSGGDSATAMIRRKYGLSGYSVPTVIFWNLRSSHGVPTKMNETGTVLLSGFSPSLMQSVLNGAVDPYRVMLDTLNHEQYDLIEA